MSVNYAVSHIMAFFNYAEVMSLLGQESYEVCHLLECLFDSLRVSTANNESIPFR